MSEPLAPASEVSRHCGPARLIRYAVFAQSGVRAPDPFRLATKTVSVLITSSPTEAVREGLPSSEHRPPLGLGGASAPWSADQAAARLAKALQGGSAVCLRIEEAVDRLPLACGWRNDRVGLGFPVEDAETILQGLGDIETRTMMALPLSLPAGTSPYFSLFDRATLAYLPGEPRPLSLVSITGPTASVSIAYRPEQLDPQAFARIADAAAHPVSDLDLIRIALDRATPPMEGFVAAWAALERFLKRHYSSFLPDLLDSDPATLPTSLVDVRERLSQAGGKGSLLNQFLLVRWGLSPRDLERDEGAFRVLNARRQQVYHRGDATEVAAARDGAVDMLLRLIALQSAGAPPGSGTAPPAGQQEGS